MKSRRGLFIIGLVFICLLWGRQPISMSQDQSFAAYPQQVQSSKEHPELHYVQQPGYYALHDLQSETEAAGAVTILNDGMIAIFTGTPSARNIAQDASVSPVYALQPGGTLAVPTGLVFLRFAEGVAATSKQADIEAAGYTIDNIPPYAPHTAWVRSQSNTMAEALAGVDRLAEIADLENVEPQMLMQRSLR